MDEARHVELRVRPVSQQIDPLNVRIGPHAAGGADRAGHRPCHIIVAARLALFQADAAIRCSFPGPHGAGIENSAGHRHGNAGRLDQRHRDSVAQRPGQASGDQALAQDGGQRLRRQPLCANAPDTAQRQAAIAIEHIDARDDIIVAHQGYLQAIARRERRGAVDKFTGGSLAIIGQFARDGPVAGRRTTRRRRRRDPVAARLPASLPGHLPRRIGGSHVIGRRGPGYASCRQHRCSDA